MHIIHIDKTLYLVLNFVIFKIYENMYYKYKHLSFMYKRQTLNGRCVIKFVYFQILCFIFRRGKTKIRVSAHTLRTKLGRYQILTLDDKICSKCVLNAIEDDTHFTINFNVRRRNI